MAKNMSSSVLEKWDSLASCSEQSSEPIFKTPSPFWNQDLLFKRPRHVREPTPEAVRDPYSSYAYAPDLSYVIGENQIHSSLTRTLTTSRYLPLSSELLMTDPNMTPSVGMDASYWRYLTPEVGYGLVKGFGKLYNPQINTLPASYFYRGVGRDRDIATEKAMQKDRPRYSHWYHEPQSQRTYPKRDCERYYVKSNPLLGSLLHTDSNREHFKHSYEYNHHHQLGLKNDPWPERPKWRDEKQTSEDLPLLLGRGEAQKDYRNGDIKSSSSAFWFLRRFVEGSLVELEGGRLKRVEDLRTEDLEQCAQIHPELMLKRFTVLKIIPSNTPSLSCLHVQIEHDYSQLTLEVSEGLPFFVYRHGWSSCNPQHTSQTCRLQCRQLEVGDLCLALTRLPTSPSEPGNKSQTEVGEDHLILNTQAKKKPTLQMKDKSRKRRFTAPELRDISKI